MDTRPPPLVLEQSEFEAFVQGERRHAREGMALTFIAGFAVGYIVASLVAVFS